MQYNINFIKSFKIQYFTFNILHCDISSKITSDVQVIKYKSEILLQMESKPKPSNKMCEYKIKNVITFDNMYEFRKLIKTF